MPRRADSNAEALRLVFHVERESAALERTLPRNSALLLAYLALQPDHTASYTEVRKKCGLGPSATTKLSGILIEAGLIVRETPRDDGRRSNLRLTARGRSEIGEFVKRFNDAAHSGLQI